MRKENLITILKNCGIAGAGGAGFPTYAKIDDRIDTLILNCAECEPLLKVHRQLLEKHAFDIMSTLSLIAETVFAKEIIIGLKKSYEKTVSAVEAELTSFPNIRIVYLREVYPTGDEVVLIRETTGKIVPPGSIPIEVGVAVMNVESVFNAFQAIYNNKPVTHTYLTVAGEVKNPVTLKAPIGMPVEQLVALAGGCKTNHPVFILGGPMTGSIVPGHEVVTKTTNAIIVLPKDHYVIKKKRSNISIDMKRAMASCCQCELCTDLCPRHLLGHPIEPHAFMRSATSGTTKNLKPFLDTLYCSSCGLCNMYSCTQGLVPGTLVKAFKEGLLRNGVKPEKIELPMEEDKHRDYKLVPMERLISRIGLGDYDIEAPLSETKVPSKTVKIKLKQHIGAKAVPIVQTGSIVVEGQLIAKAAEEGLSLPVHASITGQVVEINDEFIRITCELKEDKADE